MAMKTALTLLVYFCAIVVTGCAYAPPLPPGAGIPFAVMGDTPYSQREVQALDELIAEINTQALEFVVHVGDITSGVGPCTDEWFLARKKQFERIRHPFVLIPGDNDWTDCHRSGMDPLERLNRFRELFASGDESLGQRKMKLERQSDGPRFSEYREHMRWLAGNVLFVTLNVPGSNNNLGRNSRMNDEYRRRMTAVHAWLDEAAVLMEQRRHAGLVILIQANPDFELRSARPASSDGYADLRDALRVLSLRLQQPVMLIHGDTHYYQQNHPIIDEKTAQPVLNFTRVEVYGSPFVRWLRGVIFTSGSIPLHIAPALTQ